VLAGIDLSTLAAGDVKLLPDKRMQVTLPPPKIVHIVIDDKATKVWDRRITWWTPWVPYNPDLERQARLAARDAVERPPWTWAFSIRPGATRIRAYEVCWKRWA